MAKRNPTRVQDQILAETGPEAVKAQRGDFAGRCVAVVGDGASALASAAVHAAAGWHVTWISGGGARILSPLPTMNAGECADALAWVSGQFGLKISRPERVSSLREFRNKSFREPSWRKMSSLEQREAELKDSLWIPEARFVALDEVRFGAMNLAEVEISLRTRVLELPNVVRHEGLPIEGMVRDDESNRWVVKFGSGEKIFADRVIYADRWSKLAGMEGLPKPIPFNRSRNPSGLIQAVFRHNRPVGQSGLECGFFAALHKEAGEDTARNVLGYFFDSGMRSVWTTFLAQDEVEDNHLIAKKLRRMKQALEKLFVGPEWIGDGVDTILATLESEHVAFEESTVCHNGAAPEKCTRLPSMPGVIFLPDGYGPSVAWTQTVDLVRSELADWCAEAKFLEFAGEWETSPGEETTAQSPPDFFSVESDAQWVGEQNSSLS